MTCVACRRAHFFFLLDLFTFISGASTLIEYIIDVLDNLMASNLFLISPSDLIDCVNYFERVLLQLLVKCERWDNIIQHDDRRIKLNQLSPR